MNEQFWLNKESLGYEIPDMAPRPLTMLMWAYAQSIFDPYLYALYSNQMYEYIDTYLLYRMFEHSIGRYKEQNYDTNVDGIIDTWNNKSERD